MEHPSPPFCAKVKGLKLQRTSKRYLRELPAYVMSGLRLVGHLIQSGKVRLRGGVERPAHSHLASDRVQLSLPSSGKETVQGVG